MFQEEGKNVFLNKHTFIIYFQTQLMANIVPRSNGNVTLTFNNRGLAVREARGTTYDAHLQPGALVHFPMAAAAAAAANYQV